MTKRLGKGLSNIFGDDLDSVIENIQNGNVEGQQVEIPVKEVKPNPYQPRKVFDKEKIQELAASIKEHGVFSPILVRKGVQGYELVAGERRLRACKIIELDKIPAIILDFSEEQMMEISILENIQREDLNAIEEAQSYQRLMERLDYTQEKLSQRVGKSREYVANILRLLKLPRSIQQLVSESQLSMGHVRPLITLDDEGMAYDIATKIIEEGLSVRQVEKLVKEAKLKQPLEKEEKPRNRNLVYVEEIMQSKLQTKVKVENRSITISYSDTKDLNRILELIGCIEED